jgi:uncharacterized protein (DUF2237 family)
MTKERNVLGGELMACSYAPLTGYFRDGSCATQGADGVAHLVCVKVTQEFLDFSVAKGNDLVTPRPELRFRGLQVGDRWCLHVLRWMEAWRAAAARNRPPIGSRHPDTSRTKCRIFGRTSITSVTTKSDQG